MDTTIETKVNWERRTNYDGYKWQYDVEIWERNLGVFDLYIHNMFVSEFKSVELAIKGINRPVRAIWLRRFSSKLVPGYRKCDGRDPNEVFVIFL